MTNTEELDLSMLVDGALGDGHTDTDYILTAGEIEGLPELVQQDTKRFDYNQGKQNRSKASCTIFSALGAISDLWNYEFSLDEMKEYNDLSYTLGRVQGQGWYTKDAIDMCCKKRNKDHPDKLVAYYAILSREDDKVNKIINKNYDFNISFNYTSDYVLDLNENGEIDRAKEGEKKIIGHAVCQISKNGKKAVKDNYAGSKYQYYNVNVSNADLRQAGILHTYAYVYLKVGENNLEELKRLERVKTACINACEYNSKLRHETNDETLKVKLHDLNEYIRNNNLKYIEEMVVKLRNNE